ncbi:rna-directed dna polymerase from mobile element jockey-like [Pitangus sulphuratus]|nr:rna-directed dna polymerase from mobile element jockey-like [Pitangus sulphuratus]
MVTSQTGTDKAEVFNAFFASVFNTNDGPRGSQCPELEDHNCKNDQLTVNLEILCNLLLQLDPYKSMWPDGIRPRILNLLDNVTAKPLLMIFERFWESRQVPADWKVANVASIFKKGKKEDLRNYSSVSLTSVPGKIMQKIILGGTEKYLEDNTVIGHSQHGFMRGKSCL